MNLRQIAGLTALAAGLVLVAGQPAVAQGKKSDSVVKAKATAGKLDSAGKQVVTIVLEVAPGFHIYANPVGNEDFVTTQTTVTVTGKTKSVKVDYPKGELKSDKVVGDYKIYKDKVTIKATVERGKDDSGPLSVAIKLQACDKSRCLLPATIKLSVP
jgi:DsbC/DsbD-like thiol-disulfide interchange protein